MTPAISVSDLSFSYDSTEILRNVNFTILEHEFIGVFGPNGGGKTTLLKLLLGFLQPKSGTIKIFGKTPTEAEQLMAYVPQKMKFDPKFPINVLEVVQMGQLSHLNFFGRLDQTLKKEAERALEHVGLSKFSKQPFGTLSGGQAQRALIARALVSRPKILLLDEPTAGVDVQGEKELFLLLKGLKKEMTILMVTHHLSTAIGEVDRVLLVQKEVSSLKKSELCGHFAIGLYHPTNESVL